PAPLAGSARPATDVVFVRRTGSSVLPPNAGPIWTMPLAPPLPFEDDREQVFESAVSRSLILGVLAGGAAAGGLGLPFVRGVLRPVSMLTLAAQRMEHGDLSQRVPVTSRDEIGQLAHAFNSMADALAHTEQLRRGMVADVAHELRTPLTNLRGYLEALKDGVTPASPSIVDSLYEEAMLLNQLVDDLQDLTLAEAGRLRLWREPVEAYTPLVPAAQAMQPRAPQQGVEVVVLPANASVQADPQRIGQVLRNLLANALMHTPAGGTIELRAEPTLDGVRFEVR